MGGPGSGKSNKPITRTRKLTRWACNWDPIRKKPRTITGKDAARIMCAALANGGTSRTAIVSRSKLLCPDAKDDEKAEAASEMAIALEMMANIDLNNILLEDSFTAFLIINGILLAAIGLFRVVPHPLVRAISIPASAARTQVAALITRNIAQRAANDALYLELRQLTDAARRLAA